MLFVFLLPLMLVNKDYQCTLTFESESADLLTYLIVIGRDTVQVKPVW